ncbi:MAG: plasma-membrane proton-efflux P-type ATPase, partial [Burkholderiales bacterium]
MPTSRLAMTISETLQDTPPPVSAWQKLVELQSRADVGLTHREAALRLQREGPNEIPEKKRHPLLSFIKKFWNLSAWMIELIAILSFIIHKTLDMWIALSLLVVNAILGFAQEQRASTAVAALRSQLQVMARVLREGTWQTLPARELVKGDVTRIRAGDFVPADLQIIEGVLQVDQSALTGESHEVEKQADAALFSGSVVRQGEATAVVVSTGTATWFGRTTQLVETAHPQLHVEKVIARVVRWLVILVSLLVSLTLLAAFLEGMPLLRVLPVALAILMNAVPVALPVMFTVSMALGSLELTRQGVLITQLSAVEDAATMDVLCADKTGTLTRNQLSVAQLLPQPGTTETELLQAGCWASNEANNDPIDLAILDAAKQSTLPSPPYRILSFAPFSAATRRTEAVIETEGQQLRYIKGALRTVGKAAGLDETALTQLELLADQEAAQGRRTLAVACAVNDAPLKLLGLVTLYDPPRPDSRQLIAQLRNLGISIKMLTGDALPVASEVARQLGLAQIVRAPELRALQNRAPSQAIALTESVDGFAEVFPEDKFLVVQSLQTAGHIVGMTGDGVNDAPALRQAEVGIAVSGATDVAKGAASAVLTTEGLSNIIALVKTGRAIYQRVLTWILYKVAQTLLKAGFVVVSFLVLGKFAISLLGIVLLVFMNDFMMISLATDHVRSSQKPETWN